MFLYISILLLALFDMVATHYSIVVYGTFAIEANPIMRWMMEEHGLRTTYAFRLFMAIFALLLMRRAELQHKKLARTGLWIFFLGHVTLAFYHIYITQFFTIHG